jgi:hypothetical protein
VAEVKPLLELVEQHLPMAEASFEQLFIKGRRWWLYTAAMTAGL